MKYFPQLFKNVKGIMVIESKSDLFFLLFFWHIPFSELENKNKRHFQHL